MMVKPSAGRQVPDPERGGFLPPEGREVEANVYWLRRLEDGDVIEFNPKSTKPKGADK
ncbi:MAG: DUF2635 domain-containing protein [Betaproteobacteria bacterium]|nr:DUF2635 domain-containing protein [Betaproteobacteria bacterium]